jgi:hypothetical protein
MRRDVTERDDCMAFPEETPETAGRLSSGIMWL